MIALIDADVLVYRVGFTTENETEEFIPRSRFDEMVESILDETNATEYKLYLSDSTKNNFRTTFYPAYKANRTQPRPKHYDLLKEHAISSWSALVTKKQEADDALGIEQTIYNGYLENPEYGDDGSVICTIDKDLKQVPGNHYNFVKKEKDYVSPEQGLRYFYQQLLTGDTSDNIQGCPKVGPSRASKALEGLSTEGDYIDSVRRCYLYSYARYIYSVKELNEEQIQFVENQILVNGICLKIRTQENEVWSIPQQKQIQESQ